MRGPNVVSRRTEADDRSQQVVWRDTGAHLASGGRRFKQCLKRGPESLVEVRGQGVEGWISRVERCGESAFSRDEVHVQLHPSSQRLTGLMRARAKTAAASAQASTS